MIVVPSSPPALWSPQPNQNPLGASTEQEDRNLLKSSAKSFQNIKSEELDGQSSLDLSSDEQQKVVFVEPVIVMSSSNQDITSIRLHTEKLDVDNFSPWRWGIINTLAYKNLDGYILAPHTPEMKAATNYDIKRKQVTNFIWLHLSYSNLNCFVPNIMDYDPKALWDSTVSHFAAKTVENLANALDRLFDSQFLEGEMENSVTAFRAAFRRVVEISAKFDRKSLEAVAVVFALKQLPASFAVFRQLQFASFKDDEIKFDDFLTELKVELRRQAKAQLQQASAARALAVSRLPASQAPTPFPAPTPASVPPPAASSNKRRGWRPPPCANGVHDPTCTTHTKENCWHLYPHKEMEHYQKAIDRVKSRSNPTASLGVSTDLSDTIILDSGASGHFLKHKAYFHTLSATSSSVFGANGAAIPILGFGPATIHTMAGPVQLSLAYYLPQLSNSLISLTHYVCLGFAVFLAADNTRFECRWGAEVIFTGTTQENVLLIDTNPLHALSIKLPEPIDIHRALGHPSLPYLSKAFPNLRVSELACEDCNRAKMHKQPFSGVFPTFENPLDCVHMDLCGPITPALRGGEISISLRLSMALQISNNGGKFCNKPFASLFDERGIQHLTSAPYTLEQNPLAERGNRTTVKKACALLSTSGLPLQWWGEAVQLSVYLENCSPDSSIGFALPYKKWHGWSTDLSHLVPFGCRAVVLQEKKKRGSKLAPSGVEAIFINYDVCHHTYKLWVPKTNELVVSHHIRFFPQTFPWKTVSNPLPSPPILFDFQELDDAHPTPAQSFTPRLTTPDPDQDGG
ncbi:hypothetical protein PCASD_19703 [Puccinia coronata f. sp. avenae]|uniref:Integrase catalytic domain-containing protein n=1 Tax=Puccinia coronata f. sp. avenae TaxID=200324 RepID=A0A2N5SKU0_9BASI|nr:hypothetical protein PCASD_19703 [Puccinia coronata f. sp. avenae]